MNSRFAASTLFVVIVLAGGWLRFDDLGEKPIHADEAVQGWKTGVLLENGFYRYDPTEHHGPTLYYLAAPIAWLAGERSVADLQIGTLRLLPAIAGLMLVAATGLVLLRATGRNTALCAAAFSAVSPLLVFYSRHYIQETLFALFSWMILCGLWFWLKTGRTRWVVVIGVMSGLLVATKETWPLVAGAICAGLLTTWAGQRNWSLSPRITPRQGLVCGVIMTAAALGVAVMMFTSFFSNWKGLGDAWSALWLGANRAGDGGHAQPWYTYITMLGWNTSAGHTWTESAVFVFALLSIPLAFGKRDNPAATNACACFLFGYTLFLGLAYSIIPYKTPWLACGFWHGATVLAGFGAAHWIGEKRPHAIRLLFGCVTLAVCVNLAIQARQLSVSYSADPRNPYNYVQTSSDLNRLPARLAAIASVHPKGKDMIIKVVVPEYWPLPWLLRDFPNTGFWETVPSDPDANVLLIRSDLFATLPGEFRANLATELFGLRDGAIIVMAVKRPLWEQSLPPES